MTAAKIDEAIKKTVGRGPLIAIGRAGTAVIAVQASGKRHEVSYRGAGAYHQTYPKIQILAQFANVEKTLANFAAAIAKGTR